MFARKQPKRFSLFADITKSEGDDERIVVGIATTETMDGEGGTWNGQTYEGDIIDKAAVESALGDYMEWANIREMHLPSAVGTVLKAEIVNGRLQLTAKIVDHAAWEKVREGVYRGFSIGGKVLKAIVELLPDGRRVRRVLKLLLSEISLVDRPANPDAKILLWKFQKTEENPMTREELIAAIQLARNECELGGDLEGAELYTQAIALVLQAAGVAEHDEGMEAGADAEPEEGRDLMAGAKTTNLRKAGRKISGEGMAAMHKVVKTLLEMMSMAGDETARKMAAMYGASPEAEPPAAKGATTGDLAKMTDNLAKSIGQALVPQFSQLTKLLGQIEVRTAKLEAQPAPGGPALRSAEKTLPASTTPPAQNREDAQKNARIEWLTRGANTEPNPTLRKQYRDELAALGAA